MKRTRVLEYVHRDSIVHRLSGCTKLLCFLIMSTAAMFTFDIRLLIFIMALSLVVMYVSKTKFKEISIALIYILIFLLINFALTFVFSPQFGPEIYGTKHVLFAFSERYTLTLEQVFYQISKLIKYLSLVPFGLLLFLTTDPSEFASSLNRIGVPYRICTALSLTLRYFPDVQRDFTTIHQAGQARGFNNGKGAKLVDRFKGVAGILVPLLFSTLDRIEVVSNAMELRSYGKKDKRTWYNARPFTRNDYIALALCTIVLLLVLYVRFFINHSIYYNPFI
jgi:energy-coupling factor transport system permease protein